MTRGSALLWTIALAFLLIGTFATTPWLVRDGGWLPVAACAAWGACIPGVLYLVVCFAERRLTVSESPPVGLLLILLAVLVSMLLVPPAAIAFFYGPELATGAGYVSALFGLGGIVASALVYNWRFDREAAKRERFLARFNGGPVGIWRGVRLGFQRVEEGCQIVFNPDGAGHYRLWDGAENEAAAEPRPFHWRQTDENRIELSWDDGESKKELEFLLPYNAANTADLILRLPGVELPEIVPYEVGFAEFDRVHWPRYVVFDYLGEPTGLAS